MLGTSDPSVAGRSLQRSSSPSTPDGVPLPVNKALISDHKDTSDFSSCKEFVNTAEVAIVHQAVACFQSFTDHTALIWGVLDCFALADHGCDHRHGLAFVSSSQASPAFEKSLGCR